MAIFKAFKKSKEFISKAGITGTLQEVDFSIYAPHAHEVYLAGSFNDWNTGSLPLKKEKAGMWNIKVKLPKGRYEYKLIVDGKWAQNTPCSILAPNTFGTNNCVVAVA
jgi:1,4-alpha-glucan branching enzyme